MLPAIISDLGQSSQYVHALSMLPSILSDLVQSSCLVNFLVTSLVLDYLFRTPTGSSFSGLDVLWFKHRFQFQLWLTLIDILNIFFFGANCGLN